MRTLSVSTPDTGVPVISMMPGAVKISAVLITYNEEHCIGETLSRLYWCDEIIVVDSYSSDNTVAICKEYGCRIEYRSFDGYGTQKNFAMSLAKNNWILAIDADEVLEIALISEIQKEVNNNPSAAAFSIPMNLVFLNKEFTKGKESTRSFTRLFNKNCGGFSNEKVHESIQVSGNIIKLKSKIRHFSYMSVSECLDKCNRYSTYSAEISFKKRKNKSIVAILFGLPFNFFKYYILEKNFLNGVKGFYWSVFSAYYHFAKYVKLREMNAAAANISGISSTLQKRTA